VVSLPSRTFPPCHDYFHRTPDILSFCPFSSIVSTAALLLRCSFFSFSGCVLSVCLCPVTHVSSRFPRILNPAFAVYLFSFGFLMVIVCHPHLFFPTYAERIRSAMCDYSTPAAFLKPQVVPYLLCTSTTLARKAPNSFPPLLPIRAPYFLPLTRAPFSVLRPPHDLNFFFSGMS